VGREQYGCASTLVPAIGISTGFNQTNYSFCLRRWVPGLCKHPSYDAELVRDVFWDLFRQGFITLGLNDSNPQWPFFRLSYFGERARQTQSPYRFHDTTSFLKLVRVEVPDISDEAVVYLEEAVAAFHAGCLLASCVMLGVAAEAEFLRLIDVACRSGTHCAAFAGLERPAKDDEVSSRDQTACVKIAQDSGRGFGNQSQHDSFGVATCAE
jgi:hypothetical protein